MDFWADLWGFLTAAGTIGMAVATYVIIRHGRRQHLDRFRPICVLVPFSGVDPLNKRGELIERVDPFPDNPSFGTLAVKCTLRNLGTGPALELMIKFKFLDMNGWTTERWELGPLAAGESRGGENAPLLVPVRIHEQEPLNRTDFSDVTGKLWEIWLEYQDVFGSRFYSVHHKRPLRMEHLQPVPGRAAGPGQPTIYAPRSHG